jgi:hypothetical protein
MTTPRPAARAGVRHHRRVPPAVPPRPTEACPGCGAVLVRPGDAGPSHPGASPSCARLFEVTLRGLREEAPADAAVAAVVRRADIAYVRQHGTPAGGRPEAWRTTIADVAADLDVIDLGVLVEAWARSVEEDWTAVRATRQ